MCNRKIISSTSSRLDPAWTVNQLVGKMFDWFLILTSQLIIFLLEKLGKLEPIAKNQQSYKNAQVINYDCNVEKYHADDNSDEDPAK